MCLDKRDEYEKTLDDLEMEKADNKTPAAYLFVLIALFLACFLFLALCRAKQLPVYQSNSDVNMTEVEK